MGEEKDEVVAAYREASMFKDREVDIRLMELSEKSCDGVASQYCFFTPPSVFQI